MSTRIDIPGTARNIFGRLLIVLGCILRFGWLMVLPKAVLLAKLLVGDRPGRPGLLWSRQCSCREGVEAAVAAIWKTVGRRLEESGRRLEECWKTTGRRFPGLLVTAAMAALR